MADTLLAALQPELVDHELESVPGQTVFIQIPTLGELEEVQNEFFEAYRDGDEKKNLLMKDLVLLHAHTVQAFVKDADGEPRFETLDIKTLNFKAKKMVEELFNIITGGREPKKSGTGSSSSASPESSEEA